MWRDVREVTKVDCVLSYIELYGIYDFIGISMLLYIPYIFLYYINHECKQLLISINIKISKCYFLKSSQTITTILYTLYTTIYLYNL